MKKTISYISTFNDWLARHTVTAMSSMACVYAFTFWSLLPSMRNSMRRVTSFLGSVTPATVFYVSGGVIQLVALPLIMVGQRLEGKDNDRRSKQDHEMLTRILKHIEEGRS